LESKDIISSGLLEHYAMGQANEQETLQVLQWKNTFPDVAAELLSLELALEQYAVANNKPASKKAKDNFMNFLAEQNLNNNTTEETKLAPVIEMPTQNTATKSNKYKWLAAASVALLLGSTATNYFLYNKANKAENSLATVEKTLADKTIADNENTKNLNAVFSKNAMPIVLDGIPTKAPEANAQIFYIKNTGDVYVEPTGLPIAPAGKQYQLWAIVDGKPIDGGMISFKSGNSTYGVQKMKSFGQAKVQAFAITLEDEGGKPQPTDGQMYVMKSL
jgi:hypothetical protein